VRGMHRAATTNLAESHLSVCETVHTERPERKRLSAAMLALWQDWARNQIDPNPPPHDG
jgi:hypothetical protein